MNDHDWSRFQIHYYYPVELPRLFQAWATGSGLRSFFIEEIEVTDSAGDIRASDQRFRSDDLYTWKWRHGYSLTGKFLNIREGKFIEFTFGSMLVQLRFRQLTNSTLLTLSQTGIPATDAGRIVSHMNCRICWVFFLTNLKSVLLTGIDLRDVVPERASSFEVGYEPIEHEV
jgi:hypothetical protein